MTSTKLQINSNEPNSKSPHPSPPPNGEREGVREELFFEIYLGFGIWDLEF